jgi:HEPN domain-containing protein
MTRPHEAWFQYARDDLSFAKAGLKEGFYSHVCFLSQQAVEKAMKGWLVSQEKSYPKSHDLVPLRRLMAVDWLDPHVASLKRLSEYYVPIRYPDAAVGTLPDGMPKENDAEEALRWAENIVSLIEGKVN